MDNTMIVWEVNDVDRYSQEISAFDLPSKYENVRLVPIMVDFPD
jgi:hypothetical protein